MAEKARRYGLNVSEFLKRALEKEGRRARRSPRHGQGRARKIAENDRGDFAASIREDREGRG